MENIPTIGLEIEREGHASIEMENINIASPDIEIEDVALMENEREAHVSIEMVTSIRGMLESLLALSNCCIYRVPKRLRELNLKAYTPRVVSIGPFHHGKKHLQAMEKHKLRYLKTFLNRTRWSLEYYLEVIRTWEERARDCYAETIDLCSDEFVKMILVDGSFIIELLSRKCFSELIDKSDRILNKPWMIYDMADDMLLLENQLPFFVLEGLFNLVFASSQEKNPSFLWLTHQYFNHKLNIGKLPDTISSSEIKHFVDFIHCCYLPSIPRVQSKGDNARYKFPPSVTELHEAGVKFTIGISDSLLDIKFTNNGILKIPHLVIQDSTETFFRNLIAFEQCHYEDHYTIFDYMSLLDNMINTSADVDILAHHEIINNNLGSSEDVVALFNNIGKGVMSSRNFYFSPLCENLHAYCRTPWHKWKAILKRDYFNTPWAVVSFVAAVVLLILTLAQTVFSIISL